MIRRKSFCESIYRIKYSSEGRLQSLRDTKQVSLLTNIIKGVTIEAGQVAGLNEPRAH